jgi:uncharacterized SAM-binding protein YcdF (DUF218 family)
MFILKKIISQFLMPMPLSFLICLIGLFFLWFTKKQKTGKVFVSIGLLLLLLLSYGAISDKLMRPLERKYAPDSVQMLHDIKSDDKRTISFIVVLGGGHTSDLKVPITSQLGEDSLMRLVEGIRLYRKFPAMKLILSGGSVFDLVSEAEAMNNLAKELGVNKNDIILESKSKDTIDEAHLIKTIVHNDQFFLVTSASHMPRSMAMFKKLGMNPIPAPTGYEVKDNQRFNPYSFFPDAGNILNSEKAIHEYIGILWAKLRGQILTVKREG